MKLRTQTLLAATLCLLSLGALAGVLIKRQALKNEIKTQSQALQTREQRLTKERADLRAASELARQQGERLRQRNQAGEAAFLKDKATIEKLLQDPRLKGLFWSNYTKNLSPELQQANAKATRRYVSENYGAVLEGLGLHPEKIRQCLALLEEQDFVRADMNRAAKENGLPFSSKEFTSLQTEEARRFQAEITNIMGEAIYARFKDYCERDMTTLNSLNNIQVPQGVDTSAAMTAQQTKETVAQINQLSHQYIPDYTWEVENLERLETQTNHYLKAVAVYAKEHMSPSQADRFVEALSASYGWSLNQLRQRKNYIAAQSQVKD